MSGATTLLLAVLRDPSRSADVSLSAWNDLLPTARAAGLLARLAVRLDGAGMLARLPPRVAEVCAAARTAADFHARTVRWEVDRICRALADTNTPIVLLKGAAYLLADLPVAHGRVFSDVDILVGRDRLLAVEQALRARGWEPMIVDPYDQRYYRTWMHELPPLRHRHRRTVVDVHHAILPPTGRLHPDSRRLLAAAVPVSGSPLHVLAPADMVLHSAAHLFQDGDLRGGLRDLTDLDTLLRHFGRAPDFWTHLPARAQEMELVRPLAWALRFAKTLLGTPVPGEADARRRPGAPGWPATVVMDVLARRALLPPRLDGRDRAGDLARWLLYVRSHWLRMPPLLLARHLLRKACASP